MTLSDAGLAGSLVSRSLWHDVLDGLGGRVLTDSDGSQTASVDAVPVVALLCLTAIVCWTGGAAVIAWRSGTSYRLALREWGVLGGAWWLLPGLWVVLWAMGAFVGWEALTTFLFVTPQLWLAVALAGWSATFFALCGRDAERSPAFSEEARLFGKSRASVLVLFAAAVYVVVFTAMNWQLYRGLWIPHGDSAMYEEHLWNLEHGKGFRSYLDDGRLFLGEHVQVIHLLLVPLHLLWPSQMLLELCQSLALASGA
ncbi:MAG: hypothetical protein ACREJB_18740, partial [Planctomycetaceae bacterium]